MNHNKTAIIAGSSGQIGNCLLNRLLNCDEYSKVIAVVRQHLPIEHPKLQQNVVNFENLEMLSIQGNDVYCCLGTTIKKAKTKENFKAIDFGYPLALAKATFALGASKFMLVSSMGANIQSSIFYSRIKGELEQEITNIGFEKAGIFRPSMLLGARNESRPGESIGKFLMQCFAPIIPIKYKAIQADKVAESMLKFAINSTKGIHIIENQEMLKN